MTQIKQITRTVPVQTSGKETNCDMYRLLGCYLLVGAGMVAGLDSNVASTLQGQLQAIIDAKGPYWNVVRV